jgi:hypothetical protein
MGVTLSATYNAYRHPETAPNRLEDPSFNPVYGFPEGRKERGELINSNIMKMFGHGPLALPL